MIKCMTKFFVFQLSLSCGLCSTIINNMKKTQEENMVKLTDAEALMVLGGGEHPWGSDKVSDPQVTDEYPWDADLKAGHPWDD
jgi:hypothetical protein